VICFLKANQFSWIVMHTFYSLSEGWERLNFGDEKVYTHLETHIGDAYSSLLGCVTG